MRTSSSSSARPPLSPAPGASGSFRQKLILSLLVAALAAALYLPILRNRFVYDDVAQIVLEDYIHNPAHFLDLLTFRSMTLDIIDNNRPVNVASLMLDAAIWGRNPVGFHLTNLLLHAACCVMLFLLAARLLAPADSHAPRPLPLPLSLPAVPWHLLAAAGAAAMMAAHPLNSEAVCIPTFREDLLVPFFLLAALLLAGHFPAARPRSSVLLGVAIVLAVLAAVAAKESGVGGPLLLAIYWFAFRRRDAARRPWLFLLAGCGAVVAGFVAARFLLVPKISDSAPFSPPWLGGSLMGTLPLIPIIWVFQLRNALWPNNLSADYTSKLLAEVNLDTAMIYFALALFLFLLLLMLRRSRTAALAAACFWLAILPVSSLAPMFRPIADRYMYFPMVGLCLLLGVALYFAGLHRLTRLAVPTLVAVLLVLLALGTLRRQAVWHDPESLWRATLQAAPDSPTAADNLAFELFEQGKYKEAVRYWQKGVALTRRNSAEQLAGLAIGLDALGMTADADRNFLASVAIDPAYGTPSLLIRRHMWDPKSAAKLERIAARNRGAASRAASSRPLP